MKICDSRNENRKIFSDLNTGDVFENQQGSICMKVTDSFYNVCAYGSYNVVFLSDGALDYMEEDIAVRPVEGEYVCK